LMQNFSTTFFIYFNEGFDYFFNGLNTWRFTPT